MAPKSKDALLKELNQKVADARNNLEDKYITPKWGAYQNLYDSVRVKSKAAAAWRNNIFVPLTRQTMTDLHPQVLHGIVGQGDFFQILPQDNEIEKDVKAARGM